MYQGRVSRTSILDRDGPGNGSVAAGDVNALPGNGNRSAVAVAGSGSAVPDTPPK